MRIISLIGPRTAPLRLSDLSADHAADFSETATRLRRRHSSWPRDPGTVARTAGRRRHARSSGGMRAVARHRPPSGSGGPLDAAPPDGPPRRRTPAHGRGTVWAASLYAGERSTVSGPAAAFRHGMLREPPDVVDV